MGARRDVGGEGENKLSDCKSSRMYSISQRAGWSMSAALLPFPHAAQSVATGQASKPSTITYIPALPRLTDGRLHGGSVS